MKSRTFPDLPPVVVEWDDAYNNFDEEVDFTDPRGGHSAGSFKYSEDIGWLARIAGDVVVLVQTRWPPEPKGGHSDTIPLAMVRRVRGFDGTLYYERKPKKRKLKAEAG